MPVSKQIPTLLVALVLATSAHAGPTDVNLDLDKLLADNGLISQIDQVTQSVSERTSELVGNAMGLLGVPYRRGGSSVESGFDCSGFVKAMFEQTVGLILPRKAIQQAAVTLKIERNDLQPGDLVFFNTMRHAFSHVGIYIGEGQFIHSPKPGAKVRVDSLSLAYWNRRFNGARRVAAPEPTPASPQGN